MCSRVRHVQNTVEPRTWWCQSEVHVLMNSYLSQGKSTPVALASLG